MGEPLLSSITQIQTELTRPGSPHNLALLGAVEKHFVPEEPWGTRQISSLGGDAIRAANLTEGSPASRTCGGVSLLLKAYSRSVDLWPNCSDAPKSLKRGRRFLAEGVTWRGVSYPRTDFLGREAAFGAIDNVLANQDDPIHQLAKKAQTILGEDAFPPDDLAALRHNLVLTTRAQAVRAVYKQCLDFVGI